MSKDGAVAGYNSGEFFCEIFGRPQGRGLGHTRRIRERLSQFDIAQLRSRARGAERELFNLGITFTVYTDHEAIDRILPFDVIPSDLPPENRSMLTERVRLI